MRCRTIARYPNWRRPWSASGWRTAGTQPTRCSRSEPDSLAREAGLWKFDSRWLPRLRPEIKAAMASVAPSGRSAHRPHHPRRLAGSSCHGPPRCSATRPAASWRGPAAAMIVTGAQECGRVRSWNCRSAPGSPRRRQARPVPLPDRQQRHRGVAAGRHPGRVGRHRVRLPGRRTRRATPRRPGRMLFGRFAFDVRYPIVRDWVNSPPGQRLGLAPIPAAW